MDELLDGGVTCFMAKKQEYGNESIKSLKGADRVRKRPAVIFGSDGVEGCAHSIFEIVSNSIDEAREGHGNRIVRHPFKDNSVEVRGLRPRYSGGLQQGRAALELGTRCSARCTPAASTTPAARQL